MLDEKEAPEKAERRLLELTATVIEEEHAWTVSLTFISVPSQVPLPDYMYAFCTPVFWDPSLRFIACTLLAFDMTNLGRITNSLTSLTNENTVALVNVSLDLSLLRCQPLEEYLPVGPALTRRRKEEAESGQIHRTACKLGFLFDDVIPDTPKLRRAFGKRVSEILSRPEVNPRGTDNDGPFRPFIGADCTSIWAAATSGDAAIGAFLLACMLVDAFDDAKTTTSIWCELIEDRKQQIQALLDAGKVVNPNTVVAARQDFTRSELATWDASARSWLRRADVSMSLQKTQFVLIAENVTIPYPRGGSTSETVAQTWTRAMEVLEKLLNNHPQQACDRAVILGISAWHLYPDLLVFQKDAKMVTLKDPLLPSSGILSLGLEYNGTPSDNFIRWSLALSHLRYYGDPVPVRSHERLQRVHISELWLVALGVILQDWNVPYGNIDIGMAWFAELGNKIRSSPQSHRPELSWLLHLATAAKEINGDKPDVARKLVKYGCRRGTKFLGGRETGSGMRTPFFGLCGPEVTSALDQENEVERGIEYLRQIARISQLGAHEAIISYSGEICGYPYVEWTTVSPVEPHLAKYDPETSDGDVVTKKHARWIHFEASTYDVDIMPQLVERLEAIEQRGEICEISTDPNNHICPVKRAKRAMDAKAHVSWNNPPELFRTRHPTKSPTFRRQGGKRVGFGDFRLWLANPPGINVDEDPAQSRLAGRDHTDLAQGLTWLRYKASGETLSEYLLAYLRVCQRATSS
jgi:hypothetical protein